MGDAGARVVVEEFLEGEEASFIVMADGHHALALATSQDHKRLGDGDLGPNTGGMGAYSPAPVVTEKLFREIDEKVLQKFLQGLKDEKLYYRGIIYAGIMVTADGPKVLEFNVRFGDPGTQAILMRLDSDLAELMLKTSLGRLSEAKLRWSEDAAVCVVMASGGYPDSYKKGYPITGIEEAEQTGAMVFHAGTAIQDGKLVNVGGRVLGVTAKGVNIKEAIDNAYRAVNEIYWLECFFRKDIGHRALERKT
jgi:phosphoribosylamine--glycine ligase